MGENKSIFNEVSAAASSMCIIKPIEDIRDDDLCQHQRDLLSYFEVRTSGQRIASRADLNPSDIKPMLPMLALHEMKRDPAGTCVDFRIRLLGTKMVFYYGERTGYDYAALKEIPTLSVSADRILLSLQALVKEKGPVVCLSSFQDGRKKWLDASVIYIPLSSNGQDIDMAVSYADIVEKNITA